MSATPPDDAAGPPPPAIALQLASGFVASQAVYAFAKLELADALSDGPHSAGDVAQRAGTHPDFTRRLLRTLGGFGVVDEVSAGVFQLTPVGELFRTTQGSLADLTLMWMETHYHWFEGLAGTVRTGDVAFDAIQGEDFWQWVGSDSERSALFSRAMASIGAQTQAAAVASYDFSRFRKIVDVGGAHGSFLTAALAESKEATGVLFDQPHVVAGAPQSLASTGLGDRVECVGGDFFESVPEGGDAYLMCFILHDWNDEDSVRILSNVRRAISDDGALLILESVLPPGNTPHLGKVLDMIMMTILTGVERTQDEYADILGRAGFSLDEVVPTPAPTSLLVAKPD